MKALIITGLCIVLLASANFGYHAYKYTQTVNELKRQNACAAGERVIRYTDSMASGLAVIK